MFTNVGDGDDDDTNVSHFRKDIFVRKIDRLFSLRTLRVAIT